ncbi:hypothetical protein [Calidifontibacter terrae]
MVDCERGLGRFDRALDLAYSPEAKKLATNDAIELAIVVSGVRRDMGQPDAAVIGLRIPALERATSQPWAARLLYAYADALLGAGDADGARDWFSKAALADHDGETDADDRLAELDGVDLVDLMADDEFGDDDADSDDEFDDDDADSADEFDDDTDSDDESDGDDVVDDEFDDDEESDQSQDQRADDSAGGSPDRATAEDDSEPTD